ncbi:MAG TPA: YraN family protein [Dehalococcoidia bacterium]|nr:YraN family protein [Dehalococcoidia bacterium]
MKMKRGDTGRLGEKLAQEFLEKRGFCIIETNYRCPEGEVDIVALQGGCLVFVEVRTKSSLVFGSPEESITRTKKRRLIATAHHYRQIHDQLPASWRIDLVAVKLDHKAKLSYIELIENAVTGD